MASATILSDNGVSSGSAGIKSSGGNDGTLLLQTTTSGGTATTAVTIDNVQNVGVGVTPSAWATFTNVLQNQGGAIACSGVNNIRVFQNSYYNGTNYIYKTTEAASRYDQQQGGHAWFNAPSGTAGNAITFTQAMTLDTNGKLTIARTDGTGISSIGVYNTTTASAANVFVVSDGTFQRSTSSARYKTNVENIEPQYSQNILNARPVWYRSLCADDNKDWGHWGFIAEELAEIDPRLVHWKTEETTFVTEEVDGQQVTKQVSTKLDTPIADGVQYDRFVPLLLKQLQEQQALITNLTERLVALEGK
jgi:hypothetical protein